MDLIYILDKFLIGGPYNLIYVLEGSDIDIYTPVKDHNDLNIDDFLGQMLFVEGDSHVTEYHDNIYWVRDYEKLMKEDI